MSGMGSGLSTNNPLVVQAFHRALLHQGLVVVVLAFLVAVVWNITRSVRIRRAMEGGTLDESTGAFAEPTARRLIRITFGLIWVFDGILQTQAAMPLGMISQVIQPGASGSPSWVQSIVRAGSTVWSFHPVTAAAAAVWIQVGIGLWLLAGPRGNWSRVGGVVSVGWAVVVWVFGEAFGGIFAPGLTWLFGAPGGVLFYGLAGGLVALPEKVWLDARLGRAIIRVTGLFFVGMAVLQAWPGRGFWTGHSHGSVAAGSLTSMVQDMAQTPQPALFHSWVSAFESFDSAHGWAVNLFAVGALAVIGAAFVWAHPRLLRITVVAAVVLCLADWVLIEDFGFFGGIGTDPNSMIPMACLLLAGYLAMTRIPAVVEVPASASATFPEPSFGVAGVRQLVGSRPSYVFRVAAALGAAAVTLIGVVPMAVASAEPNADPILATATDGPPTRTDLVAPGFDLLDQNGRPISLSGMRGKVVALTFLDPVCTNDCPVVASEFKQASHLLGGANSNVELVAIDANPQFLGTEFLRAFDRQEGMGSVGNWLFLTGSLSQLRQVWRSYGVEVTDESGGGMIDHSFLAEVIDPDGHTRFVLDTDPGPATSASVSSFAVTLAGVVRDSLHPTS